MKHKYLVSFYSRNRKHVYVCTRTFNSVLKFAVKNMFNRGLFTIKRLDK